MLKSFFHWKVFLNILLAIALFAGLVWLTFRWLEQHTNHGKEIPVPNVINMTVQQAVQVLDDAGLDYEVDSAKYSPNYKPFQVLQIYPSPGSRVKGGRAIIMRVNPRTWAPVQVPDVLDRYKGLAFRQLESVGLKIGDTIYEPNIQRDAVIRMQQNGNIIKPGALLPRFSTIDVVIGTGPKRNVSVPNLIGLTVQEAKVIIANNLFEIGLVEYDGGTQDDSYIVYYQDPEGGSLRDQGMQIDLWASRRTPAEMGNKIKELNRLYRIQVDTSLPPIRYEEVPVYHELIPVPEPVKTPPKQEPPKQEVAKSTPAKPANSNADKASTKSTTMPKPAAEKPKAEEKPKVKKVIVE